MTAQRIPLQEHAADAAALLAPVLAVEPVPLGSGEALGRVAARDVRAAVDVPGQDNSQMDGFAVRAADLAGPGGEGRREVELPLGETVAAGDAPGALAPGTARAIMTGAEIPEGADAVVPVEESAQGRFVQADGAAGEAAGTSVRLRPAPTAPGRCVRPRGSDTHAGDVVLREGQELTPARIAHLAACGIREVEVIARVRVVVVSTGSEIGRGGAGHGVFDANGPGLAAALREAGAEVLSLAAVPDDPRQLLEHLHAEVERVDADLIITSGGVSKGAFEVVRQAAELPGASLAFPSVAMQPGGPQGIGTLRVAERAVPWLAFPGNPVSALLSCELIARPALRAPRRRTLHLPVQIDAAAEGSEQTLASPEHLAQHRRAQVLPSGRVRLVGGASSHLIGALAAADALAVIPVGTAAVRDGDLLETLLIPGGLR